MLELDNQNTLVGFKEKPIQKYDVSMGIYMVSKRAVEYIPENTFYGFDHLMIDLMKDKKEAKVKRFDGYWSSR